MTDFHPDATRLEALQQGLATASLPTWALVSCDHPDTRSAYLNLCAEALEGYDHLVVDLSEIQIESLAEVLRKKLPEPLFRTSDERYLIHLTGLEASFLEEIMTGISAWAPALEAEQDALLSEFPFAFVIWTDAYAAEKLRQEAPGFYASLALSLELAQPAKTGKPDAKKAANVYEALIESGQWEKALGQIQAAIASESAVGEYAQLRYLTGNIFFDQRRWELAAGFYRDVIDLEETEANAPWIARSYRGLGAAYANKGEIEAGMEALETAAEQLEALELYEELGRCFNSQARIYQATGQPAEALQHHLYAAESYREAEMPKSAGAQLRMAAHIYEARGKAAKAIALLESSVKEFEQAGEAHEQALGYQHMGALYQRQMQWEEALAVSRRIPTGLGPRHGKPGQ